jgi:hypothetical protein
MSHRYRIATVAIALAGALALVVSGRPDVSGPRDAPAVPVARAAGTHTTGLLALSPAARAQISDAIGADSQSYLVHRHREALYAPNPGQGLTAVFRPGGVWVAGASGHIRIDLTGAGFAAGVRKLVPVRPTASADRVVYRRSGIQEWYANGPLGLEQGFTIARPSGQRPHGGLTLRLAVAGDLNPSLMAGGRGVEFMRGGIPVLRYAQLEARDARGVPLASSMRVVSGQILLNVDVRGASYPLSVDPLIQSAPKLVEGANEEIDGGDFGWSVGLSQDGNTAVVGGPEYEKIGEGDFNGAAWVFVRSGDSWVLQSSRLRGSEGSDFGESVAISPDGNTIVVGAPHASGGAVWTFTRNGTTWSSGTKTPSPVGSSAEDFGEAVALSSNGEVMFAGAPEFESGRGGAWVYTKSGSEWVQEDSISSPEVGYGLFGSAIALSETGATAIIGAPATKSSVPGAAWIFQQSGKKWVQQGETLSGSEEEPFTLGVDYGGDFGGSVAISADGNTALVGGFLDHQAAGAAWGFTRSGTAWSQQGPKITARGELNATATGVGGFFGIAVALTPDGNTAIIGAAADNEFTGAAWTFKLSEGRWGQQPGKLLGGEESEGGAFGNSVAIAADGRTAIIGGGRGPTGLPPVVGGAWIFSLEPPSATTGNASQVGATSATLGGLVDPDGSEVAECAIEYGPAGSFASSAACPHISGIGATPEPVTVEVRGLAPDTMFNFRVRAVTEGGSSTGATAYFTTTVEEKAAEQTVLASGPTLQPLLRLALVPATSLDFARLRVKAAPHHPPNPPNLYKVTGLSPLLRAAGTTVRYRCDPCLIVNRPFRLDKHTNVPRTHRSLAEGTMRSLLAEEPELYAGSVLNIEISETGYRPALITYHLRVKGKIERSPVCSASPGPIAVCQA